ncbi:coiled-coil domain-containing protein 187 isoform X5 [Cavia porcellus]|uniref:coiled-coil domain-containing protein 187 isoform X5 n=2 Tax=Cavia porcellus TaxID=10141 RepID=UPI002FE3F8F0
MAVPVSPREDRFRRPAAEDCVMAMLRWPGPAQQPGATGTHRLLAWSDTSDTAEPWCIACRLPVWSSDQEAQDGDSSVSSGPLSGSSGGHMPCAPPHGPWKERPPLVSALQQLPRKSDPRLERLRDRIRQQAWGQASCASLGTSAPSSTSYLCSTSTLAPRRRTRKVTAALPAPAHPGFSILRMMKPQGRDQMFLGAGRELSRATWHQTPGNREEVLPLTSRPHTRSPPHRGPRDKPRRTRSRSCRRDKGPGSPSPSRAAKGKDPESIGVHAWRRGRELAWLLLGPPPSQTTRRTRPARQSAEPSRDLGPAVGLGSSRLCHALTRSATAPGGDFKKALASEGSSVHTWPERPTSASSGPQVSENTVSLASHSQQATIQSAMAILQDLRQQIQAGLELAQSPKHRLKHKMSKMKPQNLAQQGTRNNWLRQGSFLKSPCNTPEGTHSNLDRARRAHPQQASSTSTEWEPCPQRARAARGWEPCFQRPRSPPEKLSPFPQQPWSVLPRQACPQQAWVKSKDWGVPEPRPWSPKERLRPAPRRNGSYLKRTGSSCKGRGATTPPSEARQAWLWSSPRQEPKVWSCPPHLQPRRPLGHSRGSEALCDFMCQKAQAERQQALQQTAMATDVLEQRSQRLQEVYRRQREAMQGKTVPVVSQTSPGIVTFVPSSAQSEVLKAPGSLEPPERGWSKVTSGVVLGDQEIPGSFCLCLNRAWNRPATPLPVSASLPRSLQLQDPGRGLHICLDPQAAERLSLYGPLHAQHKQARLQALETMADVLQQRIDILTAKLRQSETSATTQDLASELLPLGPSTTPSALACPGALVPSGERGSPREDFLDMKPLPRAPVISSESQHQVHCDIGPFSKGALQEGHWQPEQRLCGDSAVFQAAGTGAGSTLRVAAAPHPTCGSPWLEEKPAARGAGLTMPWTPRSCGPQEPGVPCPRDQGGHLPDFQMKSSSSLKSLKGLMGKHKAHGRLETASKLEQPQIHAGPVPAPTVPAQSPDPARARSGPALGKYVTGSSQGPEKGQASAEGRSASAEQATPDPGPDPEPAQPRLARICPPDGSAHQGSAAGTESANPGAGETAGRLSIAVLEQKPQEETLLQQHWAALLRLRKTAREEKARAERALQEHQLGCLEHRGHGTTGAALGERAPQALSRLEEERVQREMPGLQDMHWPVLQGGQQLPQQQEATLTAQRTPTPRLQSPGPQVKAAGEGASEAGQQLEGALCPPKPHRSCSPVSPRVQRGSKSAEVTQALQALAGISALRLAELWTAVGLCLSGPRGRAGHPCSSAWGAGGAGAAHRGHPDPGQRLLGQEEAPSSAGWLCPRLPGARPAMPGGRPSMLSAGSKYDCRKHMPSWTRCCWEPGGEAPGKASQRAEVWGHGQGWDPKTWRQALAPPAPVTLEEKAVPPIQPRPATSVHLGSELALSWGSSGSPASSPLSSPGSGNGLSHSSLQEFQKAIATLAQLSNSSESLSDLEAEGSLDTDPSWSEELCAHKDFGPPSSLELHQGDPQPGAVPAGAGPVTWQRPERDQAARLPGPPGKVTVAEASDPEWSCPQAGRPPPPQDIHSPSPGSELSETSSQIWIEDNEENLRDPGTGAQPSSGSSSTLGSSSWEHSVVLPTLVQGEGQEPSRASWSLNGGSNTESPQQVSSKAPSTSDLDL